MSLDRLLSCMTLFLLVVSAICANVAMNDFKRFTTCDDVRNTTSATVLTQRECAVACARQDWCKSFSVKTTAPKLCYLHSVYLKAGMCEGQYKHYKDIYPCYNGGEYNDSSGNCICYDGYVGDHCERLMKDCSEGYLYSYYANQNDIFLCHPKGAPAPIRVRCFMTFKGRTLLMTQTSGNQNYTRKWEEYKRGFGSLSGDHWLGNDFIHYITSGRSHYLTVQLWTPGNSWSNKLAQRFYHDFHVGPEVDDYKMTFSSSVPNAKLVQLPEGCLVNATLFSTVDVDHSSGAVGLTRSGFWHANPPKCNPTGQLKTTDTTWGGDKTDVFWQDGIDGEAVNRIDLFLTSTNPNDLA